MSETQATHTQDVQTTDRRIAWSVLDVVLAVVTGTGIGIVLGGISGALLLGGSGVSDSVMFLVIGTFIYGGIALMSWLLVVKRRSVPIEATGLNKAGPGPILLMIPLTLGVLIMNFIVSLLTATLFGDVPTAEDQLALGSSTLTIVDLVCLLIVGAILAPLVEEFVFRGLLYRAIRSRSGIGAATLITALSFALVHFTPLLIGVFFFFGIILAMVAERFDSLYPPIVLHALNNTVAIGLVYLAQ